MKNDNMENDVIQKLFMEWKLIRYQYDVCELYQYEYNEITKNKTLLFFLKSKITTLQITLRSSIPIKKKKSKSSVLTFDLNSFPVTVLSKKKTRNHLFHV